MDHAVELIFVPGHVDIAGNQAADRLEKEGWKKPLIGSEPACGIAHVVALSIEQAPLLYEYCTITRI